jgi:hypothetical protein
VRNAALRQQCRFWRFGLKWRSVAGRTIDDRHVANSEDASRGG